MCYEFPLNNGKGKYKYRKLQTLCKKSNDFIDKWIVIRKMILKKVKQRLTFFVVAKKIQQTVSAVFAF